MPYRLNSLQNMKLFMIFFIYLIVTTVALNAEAQQTLLLVGGGARPPVALKEWLKVNTKQEPNVLIITWASATKKAEYEKSLQDDLSGVGVKNFLYSRDITNTYEKNKFINDLSQATHIFFSGGSQVLIMDILNKDPQILDALQHTYWKKHIPVAGTSAGTAVQAELMMTGDTGDLVGGLGFLPKSVIDQHFFKRKREDRLRAYMAAAPENFTGLGVDEDGSVLLKRDPQTKKFSGQVLGDKNIMIIEPVVDHQRVEKILTPSQNFELF